MVESQTNIMQSGTGWYWETTTPDRRVIARGVADTHRQARTDAAKALIENAGDVRDHSRDSGINLRPGASKIRVLSVVLPLLVASLPAFSAEGGMYLCHTPGIAREYWNDLITVNQAEASIDEKIVIDIARKHGCLLLISENLKPKNFVAETLEITDGKASGFATPQSYIRYVNRPLSAN
jgi:hypothetical protein